MRLLHIIHAHSNVRLLYSNWVYLIFYQSWENEWDVMPFINLDYFTFAISISSRISVCSLTQAPSCDLYFKNPHEIQCYSIVCCLLFIQCILVLFFFYKISIFFFFRRVSEILRLVCRVLHFPCNIHCLNVWKFESLNCVYERNKKVFFFFKFHSVLKCSFNKL